MSYFSSSKTSDKTISYRDNTPDDSTKFLYTAKYPESLVIENKGTETIKKEQSDSIMPQSKSEASAFNILQNTLTILVLFLVAIQVVKPKIPTYIEDLYLTAYEIMLPKYQQVYAVSDTQADDSENVNVSRETSSEDIVSEGVSEEEKSFVQKAILRLTGNKAYEQSTTDSNNTDDNVLTKYKTSATEANGVIGRDLSVGSDKIYSTNETKLTPDLNALAVAAYPIDAVIESDEDVQVLIVHTHGTECYADAKNGGVRSTDKSENVVRVGKELCDVLNYYGITTIHSETMHDEISYLKAYNNSKAEVERLIEIHPTIKYVIDLHRDSIPNDGGNRVKPIANIAGEEVAQIMLVVGTNAAGANHPKYEDNLTVASHLQSTLNELYPTLARPINIRKAAFNQGFGAGCMLLEVGSDANTLDEALKAVRLFGAGFARMVA